MFNHIEWRKNDENCISNAEKVKRRDGTVILKMDNGTVQDALQCSTRWRRRMRTNHAFMQNIFVFESFHKRKSWELFQQAQLSDRSEVHIVNILDEYGLEVAIPSICKPGDVTYVVISRETERFVNEIHAHEAQTRSSRELLENLQESK